MIGQIIESAPIILVALGFVLWAASRFVEAKAKANPVHDKWNDLSPALTWASSMYSQAIDWLCEAKVINYHGKEKLKLLNSLVNTFKRNVEAGNYTDAITEVVGYWRDAKNKIASLPIEVISLDPSTGQSLVANSEIGPETMARE